MSRFMLAPGVKLGWNDVRFFGLWGFILNQADRLYHYTGNLPSGFKTMILPWKEPVLIIFEDPKS
jgi:hypothetical protein